MDWIRVDAAASKSPKVRKLAKRLGVTRHAAAGLVLDLWSWTAMSRERGDLNGLDAEDIAIACDWDGDPEAFLAALVACRIIDRTGSGLQVHDWITYQGRVFDHRERTQRWRKQRDVTVTSPSDQRDVSETTTDRQTDRHTVRHAVKRPAATQDGILQAAQSKRLQAKDAKAKGDHRNAHRLEAEALALETHAGTLP